MNKFSIIVTFQKKGKKTFTKVFKYDKSLLKNLFADYCGFYNNIFAKDVESYINDNNLHFDKGYLRIIL